ncbi:hypothetical protein BT69DRAFT_1212474 [Atractiella rhizophila]|nr:hypothetical protein BT69DRAFT_1212474 [Atractiella rhizophila]
MQPDLTSLSLGYQAMAPPSISRRPRRKNKSTSSDDMDNDMILYGVFLIFISCTFFILGVWSMAIAPFVPESGFPVLDWLRNDTHYKYLVPLLIPIGLYTVIVNWMGFKMFRHA